MVGGRNKGGPTPSRGGPSFADVVNNMNKTNTSTPGFVVAFRNIGSDRALPLQRHGTSMMHLVAQQHERTTQQR
eukprot:1928486-Heterocapsa_arctica.AAC.1